MLSSLLQTTSLSSPQSIPEFLLQSQQKKRGRSTEIGESPSTPVIASEECFKHFGIAPLGASGTSLGVESVHVDVGNLPIYTTTDQMATLEDNDLLEAPVDFVDSDEVHTGKKCSMPETKHT
jgi:hypothetical protein